MDTSLVPARCVLISQQSELEMCYLCTEQVDQNVCSLADNVRTCCTDVVSPKQSNDAHDKSRLPQPSKVLLWIPRMYFLVVEQVSVGGDS